MQDIHRLTRNLTDWNAFREGVRAARVRRSAGTGRDLDLSTPEGAYCGGMETLRGPTGKARIG